MQKFIKTKFGFTLVELLVVIVIMSTLLAIGVPLFRGVGKSARIKACCAIQRDIAQQSKDYCVNTDFNAEFAYTIVSSKKDEKGYIRDGDEKEYPSQDSVDLLKNQVLGGTVPYCPAGGTIKVQVIPGIKYPTIKVTCSGGDDGENSHTQED